MRRIGAAVDLAVGHRRQVTAVEIQAWLPTTNSTRHDRELADIGLSPLNARDVARQEVYGN
jgi:hypothetical protein